METMALKDLIDALSRVRPEKKLRFENISQEGKGYKEITDTDINEDNIDPNRSGVGSVNSWRGDYSQLALSPAREAGTVIDTLIVLNKAIGETFHGWKGGEYKASHDTKIWCAEPGKSFAWSRTQQTNHYEPPQTTLAVDLALANVVERENEVVILYIETECF